MSQKIVLIDGHSILSRAFYGVPELTNSEGIHTNAVYGFLNIMFKILDEETPDYLAVAFDVKAPTFRHQMYEAYKGTRKPMPKELLEQVPLIKEVLTAMEIPVIECPGYEADDILGTIARSCEAQDIRVALVSGDRDLLQLASELVCVRIPKTKRNQTVVEDYHAVDVKAAYQVTPAEFIDVKALMGDASDNIPGVPGIGEKTATNLIVAYQSIENAYAHVDEIKPARAQNALREHYDMAQMSKTLATIKTDCPLDFALAHAKLGNLYTKEAFQYMKRLEFKSMLSRFSMEEQREESEKGQSCREVTKLSEAEKLLSGILDRAKAEKCAALGLQMIHEQEQLLGLAIACEEDAAYIPCQGFVTEEYLGDWAFRILETGVTVYTIQLKEQLAFIVEYPGKHAGTQGDGVFSQAVKDSENRVSAPLCWNGHGDLPKQSQVWDLSIAAYLVNPLKDTYDADDLARDYRGTMLRARADLFGKQSLIQAAKEQHEDFLTYVGGLCVTALKAGPLALARVEEMGMGTLYRQIEMPLVQVLAHMQAEGVAVEKEALKEYGDHLVSGIQQLEQKIYEGCGEVFNINSPKQLGVILFEKLHMPFGKKTKTGYSTSADVLEKLRPDYPVVGQILEYRQLTKLKSTYADGLAAFIRKDGRIHGKFHQTITATGRISSTEPNLQNIPIRMELGRAIRKVFVPREGFVFVDADYSQIELRVLAHMSGDERLIEAYGMAQDIHAITASQVFHTPLEEVTPLQRRNAKAVNFGIVYGISAFGLSEDLSISRKEATEYIDRYFKTYPGVKAFLDGLVKRAKKEGSAVTMFGRVRPVPELDSSNFMQRQFGERVAMNSPIQGTAADIIKIAMIRVDERLRREGLKSRLVLQIHDELLVEAARDEVEQVSRIMRQEMEGAAELSVALEVDLHTGETWFDAK